MARRLAREDCRPIFCPGLSPLPSLRRDFGTRSLQQLPGAWIVFRDCQSIAPFLNDVSADTPMKGNRFHRFVLHRSDKVATKDDRICPVTGGPWNRPIAVTADPQIAAHFAEESSAPADFRRFVRTIQQPILIRIFHDLTWHARGTTSLAFTPGFGSSSMSNVHSG